MQEKQDQKVAFVFLSIHTNFEPEEHTQKNKTQIMKNIPKFKI